jgi:D-amino-acid dehydrogenase
MRIVVVGAGIVGLCCAWSLAKRGWDVTVLTAEAPGSGASSVNAGWIVPTLSGPLPGPGVLNGSLRWMLNPSSPFYVRPRLSPSFLRWMVQFGARCNTRDYQAGLEAMAELNRRTMMLYDELRADGLKFEEHRTGVLMAFRTVRNYEHGLADIGRLGRLGYPEPVLGAPGDFEPLLADGVRAAFLLPGERHVDPVSVTAALTQQLRRNRVEIRRAEVLSVMNGSGAARTRPASGGTGASWPVVTTREGTVRADAVVVAAGVWTPEVTRGLGTRVPIISGKGYALDFAPAPFRLSQAVYLHEDRVGVSPYDDHLRLSGTMELTGLDQTISRRRIRAIGNAGARAFRDWPADARPARVSSGLRPLTPDGLPLIGPLKRAPSIYLAAGHSMLGMTLGPATGEALAGRISGEVSELLAPFDPARFG